MKADTMKLYDKMTSQEKARLYHRSDCLDECSKIKSSVPWKDYSCLDFDYTDDVKYLTYAGMWAEIEYWRTTAKLKEHMYEACMYSVERIHGNTDKALSELYVSKLKGIELALEHHGLEYVIPRSEVAVNADGLLMVYELELNTEYLEAYTKQVIGVIDAAMGIEGYEAQRNEKLR